MLGRTYKTLFLLAGLLIWVSSSGQDGLLVKSKKNGKAWFYEKGSKVTYIKFHDEDYSSGRLNALIDTSAVVLGKDTILVSDIAGLRKRSPLHKLARIIGMPLMLLGSLAMADGAADVYKHHESVDGLNFFLLGAGMFALGYMPYMLNLPNMDVGYRGTWTLIVQKGKPLPH